MPQPKPTIRLRDLVDQKRLQSLQDAIASSLGVATRILAPDGKEEITHESNGTSFCSYWLRTRGGKALCEDCDRQESEMAARAKEGKPYVYQCHAGLYDFVAPIIVDEQHIASVHGGQVLTDAITPSQRKRVKELASKLNCDKDGLLAAFRDVHHLSKAELERAAQVIFCTAEEIAIEAVRTKEKARTARERARAEAAADAFYVVAHNLRNAIEEARPDESPARVRDLLLALEAVLLAAERHCRGGGTDRAWRIKDSDRTFGGLVEAVWSRGDVRIEVEDSDVEDHTLDIRFVAMVVELARSATETPPTGQGQATARIELSLAGKRNNLVKVTCTSSPLAREVFESRSATARQSNRVLGVAAIKLFCQDLIAPGESFPVEGPEAMWRFTPGANPEMGELTFESPLLQIQL